MHFVSFNLHLNFSTIYAHCTLLINFYHRLLFIKYCFRLYWYIFAHTDFHFYYHIYLAQTHLFNYRVVLSGPCVGQEIDDEEKSRSLYQASFPSVHILDPEYLEGKMDFPTLESVGMWQQSLSTKSSLYYGTFKLVHWVLFDVGKMCVLQHRST